MLRQIPILLFLLFLLSGFQSIPKSNPDIVLHDEKLQIIPKEFYVTDVMDDRADKSAVAWVLPETASMNSTAKTYPMDFRGGGLSAVRQFINRNLPINTALRPVVIHIKKFAATESLTKSGIVEGRVSLSMSFDLKYNNDDEPKYLTDYSGGLVYSHKPGQAQDIEPYLRHVLESGLEYFDKWMNQQAGNNIKLAKSVSVNFTDYSEKEEGDTVYYSVKRPIKWNDFQSKITDGKYAAEVFPSFGYDEHTELIKGVVHVHLAMKVFLPKSACWVRPGSESEYALNHEQRHFDIVKLVAEHLEQKIKSENLPVDNFDGYINVDYLDAFREMNDLQKQYDDETRHGIDEAEQQHWNERIDKELGEYGIKSLGH